MLDDKILDRIQKTISKYSLFQQSDELYIGLSGGKDSLATLMLLSQLGYSTRSVSVNMGDPLFDVEFIQKNVGLAGLETNIIDARNPQTFDRLSPSQLNNVRDALSIIDSLPEGSIACAPCYLVKMYAIKNLVSSNGSSTVVLGHHRDDMIASLLKCYWIELYYKTLTKPKGIPYDGKLMQSMMSDHEKINLSILGELVGRQLAATDEPFVEYPFGDSLKLVRPLGEIAESEIVNYISTKTSNPLEMDCTFKKNAQYGPFRRLVHRDYLKRAQSDITLANRLFDYVLAGLNEDGTLKFRPRNSRDINYPGFKPFIRKL